MKHLKLKITIVILLLHLSRCASYHYIISPMTAQLNLLTFKNKFHSKYDHTKI